MSKPKTQFSATLLVHIEVTEGEDSKNNLVVRLLQFLQDQKIVQVMGGSSGPKRLSNYYRQVDADKITAWLRKEEIPQSASLDAEWPEV